MKTIDELKLEHKTYLDQFWSEIFARRKWLHVAIEKEVASGNKKKATAARKFVEAAKKDCGKVNEMDELVLHEIEFVYPQYASSSAYYTFKGDHLSKLQARILIRNEFNVEVSHLDHAIPAHYQNGTKKAPNIFTGKPFSDVDLIYLYELASSKAFTPPTTDIVLLEDELSESKRFMRKLQKKGKPLSSDEELQHAVSIIEAYQRKADFKSMSLSEAAELMKSRTTQFGTDAKAAKAVHLNSKEMKRHIDSYLPAGVEDLGHHGAK